MWHNSNKVSSSISLLRWPPFPYRFYTLLRCTVQTSQTCTNRQQLFHVDQVFRMLLCHQLAPSQPWLANTTTHLQTWLQYHAALSHVPEHHYLQCQPSAIVQETLCWHKSLDSNNLRVCAAYHGRLGKPRIAAEYCWSCPWNARCLAYQGPTSGSQWPSTGFHPFTSCHTPRSSKEPSKQLQGLQESPNCCRMEMQAEQREMARIRWSRHVFLTSCVETDSELCGGLFGFLNLCGRTPEKPAVSS